MCLVLQLNCMQDSAEVGWELMPGYWGFLGEGSPFFPPPPAWQPPPAQQAQAGLCTHSLLSCRFLGYRSKQKSMMDSLRLTDGQKQDGTLLLWDISG